MIAFCADIKYLGMVCSTELHFVCALITHCLYTIAHNNKHDYANSWYDTHTSLLSILALVALHHHTVVMSWVLQWKWEV